MITSGFIKLQPWRTRAGLLLSTLLLLGTPSCLQAAVSPLPRVLSPESIKEIPAEQAAAAGPHRARILRMALSAEETTAPMDVEVALRMRNFAEFQARVARGEIISREEMSAKYFPLAADYEAMAAWLTAQGLTVTRDDTMRLSLFARGTISQLKQAFQVDFARVTTDEGEFTSAITAPSLPAALAPSLVGVNGLQPHLRPHKMTAGLVAQKASLTSPNAPPYLPREILKAYSANTTGLTGAGQTIAIVIDTYPLDSDLTTFWSRCGISRSPNSSVQHFQVPGTPTPPDPAAIDPTTGVPYGTEAVIDAELTSSIAPGANIRVYTTGDLSFTDLSQGYQKVYNDLATQPSLHVLNLSYGIGESYATGPQKQSDAQHLAALASGGVTVFVSTGDGGSNPDHNSGGYSTSAPLQPSHPASDPNVTGVGATTLTLDTSSGVEISETGWSLNQYSKGLAGSGGGVSLYFSRPDWQTGTGVPSGTMRLVPDVSVVGDPGTGAYIVNAGLGSDDPGGHVWGGTSISAPIWSGFGALLNQARASAGLPPLGLLGPKIYPLIGTTSLRDMTSGNNGAYTAGAGYDMVTGVGAPNIAALVQAIASVASAPVIITQPVSQTVIPSQNATFSVTASGSPPPAYQWQLQTPGGTTWSNLSTNSTYSGTATATLTVNSVTDAISGNLFQCVISNTNGTATTAPAALIVTYPLSLSTLAGQAGSSGSADGTGSAARFNDPSDVATDSSGNVYVADTNNHTIRKITSAGAVTTLAGLAGTSGSTDGTGSAARFNLPAGLTVDGSGNIYVADTYNHTIRKVTATGAVSTVAGQAGTSGSADGSGGNARFNYPSGVSVDSAGNLYVADTNNFTIRKITPAGVVSTVVGLAGTSGISDGTGSAVRFSSPEGVTVDGSSNLYVADTDNHTIRKITPAGAVTTLAGLAGTSGGGDGSGSIARFQYPADLAVDSAGTLYVADTDNHTIRKITPAGLVGAVAGLAGSSGSTDGVGSAARLFYPTGVAVDGSGNVYVADASNHTIRKGMVVSAPRIQTQPQSQTVSTGASVTFSVTATGVPAPTYQWIKNAPISGATGSTYALNSVQTVDNGTYTVTVTNIAGSVTSDPATLTVMPVVTVGTGFSSLGGGGGGGAPSLWFYGALSLLLVLRKAFRRK